MSNKNDIMTNEQLQYGISDHLRAITEGETDYGRARTYYVGARTLLTSVKIDVEGAKQLGLPPFERTKRFLGLKD